MPKKNVDGTEELSPLTRRIAELWGQAEALEAEYLSRNLQVGLSVTLSWHEPETFVCINRLDATHTQLGLLKDAAG